MGTAGTKGGWTVTRLVAASTLGVLYLIFSLAGATIPAITGIPMTSGIVNFIVSAAMYSFGSLIVRQFGTATLMGFIYSLLALPLPLYGAPGFAPKILTGILTGLSADVAFLILRRRPALASYAAGAATQTTITLLVAGFGLAFNMPGVDKMIDFFIKPIPLTLMIILGGAAGLLGYWMYRRVEGRAIVRRIQSSRLVVRPNGRDQPGLDRPGDYPG